MHNFGTSTSTVILACMLRVACGDGSSTLVGPTAPTPTDVGGAWRGTGLVTSVDSGGCVGNVLAAQIGGGGTPLEAAIDQTDTRLMVTITNGVNQERCAYEGTIAGDSITVSMTSCTPRVLALGPACAPGRRPPRVDEGDALGTVLRDGRRRCVDRNRVGNRQGHERR